MNLSRVFVLIICVGLILRFFVAFWSFNYRENTDVLRYKDWGRIAYLYGFEEAYTEKYLQFGTLANNQPPGTLYIISAMYQAQIQSAKVVLKVLDAAPGSISWVNITMVHFYLRLPSIITDIAITILIYLLIKKISSNTSAIYASSFFIFNPVIIYNSSFWGQMDSLNNFFIFFGLFLYYKKKFFVGTLSIVLSFFIKLSLVFTIPFIALIIIKEYQNDYRKYLLLLTGILTIIYLLILPISLSPIIWSIDFTKNSIQGEMHNITAFAFNFWWFIFMPKIQIGSLVSTFNFSEIRLLNSPNSQELFLNVPLKIWAVIMFFIFNIPAYYFYYKMKKINYEMILLILCIISLTGFMFLPHMHERYMYPLFLFLAALVGIKREYTKYYIIFSVVNMINLYLVWHPWTPPLLPYSWMNNMYFQWSISFITVTTFIFFYISSLKLIRSYVKK